ncbi:ACP S-malonyltransferase [Flavobacteriaceae bacterium M23B6Z8]
MKAYVFPGQGAQFVGMGANLYETNSHAKDLFERANEILGFSITDIMFNGTSEDLQKTSVTQPAVFLHSVVLGTIMGKEFQADMVAGHSLGEFSALVANDVLSFKDGLELVSMRAEAMHKACEINPGAMAAVLGLTYNVVEEICDSIDGVVTPANYNCPGQLVISGEVEAVNKACAALEEAGAKRAMLLKVGGAFHSSLMEPAREELEYAIKNVEFRNPTCPVYQNVTATAVTDPIEIQKNLMQQLTSPVKWMQSVRTMIADGATSFTEIGPGRVLQGLIKKIDADVEVSMGKI